jgi:hypothetical protein
MKTRGIPTSINSDHEKLWMVFVGVVSVLDESLGGAVAVDGVCMLKIHWKATEVHAQQ